MNGVVHFHAAGSKLGNATMAFLHAYAHAQRVGAEFVATPWIGEKVFRLPPYSRVRDRMDTNLPVRSEIDLKPDETNVRITAYAQSDKAMIYTKDEARGWLQLNRSIEEVFNLSAAMDMFDEDDVVGHYRRGDFGGYGYPLVSVKSYHACFKKFGWRHWHLNPDIEGDKRELYFISEEKATPHGKLPAELAFLPDFYRMIYAPILLRANSSFSWVAALLNRAGRVYSPVIDGLKGGQEHDCKFVEGNYPKLANLEGFTDLHLKGESA